ncbi:MAG TPA: hypothetical protein PKE26_17225 [Kiritimatiellia bacterium]|nr:hypothetical protein [Saprospiraceae bacterium]HMP00842.1 hypothetical protein [Kiritimatiellia bacterium]
MHFISYWPIKNQLRDRTLSDREALPYLVVFVAISAALLSIPLFNGFNNWDLINLVLAVLAAIAGVLYSFKQNGGRKGHDLIQKFVVIGWIVTVRSTLVLIPLTFVLMYLGDAMGVVTYESTGWYDVAMMTSFDIIVYQRIGRHIRDTQEQIS